MKSPVWVPYEGERRWGSPENYDGAHLPYTWIIAHDPNGPYDFETWGLLDTGATYLMLNSDVAHRQKIDLRYCTRKNVTIASGAVIPSPMVAIEATILEQRIKVDALFGPWTTPLVGLQPILRAMEFGINFKGWLYHKTQTDVLKELPWLDRLWYRISRTRR